MQNYSILQQGFITLEAKYKRRQAEVRKHQEELRLRTEEYASQTDALTEQLAIKDKESKSLHSELKEIVHTTRAVKNIIEQVRSRANIHDFLPALTPLVHPSRLYPSLQID